MWLPLNSSTIVLSFPFQPIFTHFRPQFWAHMKGPVDRTKVVLRHLPPALSQALLLQQIDSRFADRYNWFSFRPAKSWFLLSPPSVVYFNFFVLQFICMLLHMCSIIWAIEHQLNIVVRTSKSNVEVTLFKKKIKIKERNWGDSENLQLFWWLPRGFVNGD